MQPEWLTSTVTALARCCADSSSHSTSNFTFEMTRLWLRRRAQRSCIAAEAVFVCVNVAMVTSWSRNWKEDRPGWENPKYCDSRTGSIVLFQKNQRRPGNTHGLQCKEATK